MANHKGYDLATGVRLSFVGEILLAGREMPPFGPYPPNAKGVVRGRTTYEERRWLWA